MKTITLCLFLSCVLLSSHTQVSAQTPFTANTNSSTLAAVFTESATVSNFECSIKNDRMVLNWNVAGNQMADRLIVQRSKDGKKFVMAGLVFGTDKAGIDSYQFYEKVKTRKKAIYRIIIIHKDQTVEYSSTTSLHTSKRNKNS